MKCRHCGAGLELPLIDLGSAPPSNAYLTKQALKKPEKWYPLKVLVCENCWLAQTEDYANAEELFDADYAYFSSFSKTWLEHAERYVVDMARRFSLGPHSFVIEVAANDGYLLQYMQQRGIPSLGVEPTASTAKAARAKGLHIVEDFFGVELARKLVAQGRQSDLTVANNVLAHVPDINDFVAGFAEILKPQGVATFEFPHLLQLVEQAQFDTIYHEHFSYLSLTAVNRIFDANGLTVFDVEELPTHGGSLRVFAQRKDSGVYPINASVNDMLERELQAGIKRADFYLGLQRNADRIKHELLEFLLTAKREGKLVMAYGAAAKGNTLLNYAGIRGDLLQSVVDKNPNKQGKYLPGSRILIVNEEEVKINKPDYILILPWNLCEEIINQLQYAREWKAQFVSVVPRLDMSH